MALAIEDGSGINGATSYVTLEEARAYADAGGDSLPGDDAAAERLLVRAFRYLEAQRGRFSGEKTYPAGAQWPRTGATLDGVELDAAAIPRELKDAQAQAAIDLQKVNPLAPTTGPAVRQKTVGALTTIYAVGDNAGPTPARMPAVDALLEPLFRDAGQLFAERA